jgi:two-component system response regulator DctR
MNFPTSAPPLPYVIVVDDDLGMLKSIEFLLQTEKIRCLTFQDSVAFLQQVEARPELIGGPGCLLLDLRMPGMSGLEVFDRLMALDADPAMSIIFITAHGEVSIVTRVLKQGAVDFVQKPFVAEDMLARLLQYCELSQQRFRRKAVRLSVKERIEELTEREAAVMNLLFDGLSNKEIAEKLGNSVRTIELRRASVYDKLHVKSVVELARLLESLQWKSGREIQR